MGAVQGDCIFTNFLLLVLLFLATHTMMVPQKTIAFANQTMLEVDVNIAVQDIMENPKFRVSFLPFCFVNPLRLFRRLTKIELFSKI